MEMKKNAFLTLIMIMVTFLFSSCVNDLNVEPIDPNISTANNIFQNQSNYIRALAKVYASYAISGQTGGGGGSPDIAGIDENFGNYIRQYWDLQELPTDEAIMAWDDATIKDFHWQTWSPNDVFLTALYSRIYYTIAIANEFIRNANNGLSSASGAFATDLKAYIAEARYLRALSYWHAIDMFGNPPFVTESDLPGAFFPQRITRANLFNYIESELKAIEGDLIAPRQEYGRADKGADWFLLAELYMNAQVYTGTARYTDALTYLNKVINEGGYTLDPNYAHLFDADNNTSPEIIFPIVFDGINTQQYGGMTFVIHALNGDGMPLNGVDGGWGGIRTIKDFVAKFNITQSDFSSANPQYQSADKRGMFYFDPSSWQWDITNVGTFTQGIGVTKYKNVTSTGGHDPDWEATFVSTDFPMFRLGDAYLLYAEAVVRGGSGGDMATAVGYVNALRQRAYGNSSGNITSSELTLNFLLDERGRELYWECHRRTDLIRFGQFTNGTYVWEWKGNAPNGTQVPTYRDLYPIPINDLNANPNLVQNPGY
jgi:starch-binding outer membrane protein, SusD/RagB family